MSMSSTDGGVKKPANAPPVPPMESVAAMETAATATPPPIRPRPDKHLTALDGGGGGGDAPKIVQLTGHVGFDSLPNQLVQKAQAEGFTFNLMCVGETGIGKTTLMESLFNMNLDFKPCDYELKTVELRSKTYDVEEGGVRLKLTLVETAGYGDQLDKDKSAAVIVDYINKQFESYLEEELKIRRCLQLYHDTRIQACLYFISPTGHGLKALDVVTLRELSSRVNVIPVIAKADTTSKEELRRFKKKILSELRDQKIDVYRLPEDDETVRDINNRLNAEIPFAVVGSTDFTKGKDGRKLRARLYPWGMVEVENEEHCDFVKLREALLRTNVEDLRSRTDSVLYEAYRRKRLVEMGIKEGDLGLRMPQAVEERKRLHRQEMERREQALKDSFVKRVEEKEQELKLQEEALNQKQQESKRRLQQVVQELEAELRRVDEERQFIEHKVHSVNSTAGTPQAGKKKK